MKTKYLKRISSWILPALAITIFAAGCVQEAAAQFPNADLLADIAAVRPGSRHITFHDDVNIPALALFPYHKDKFGLGESDQMECVGSKTDTLEVTSYFFRQRHNGVKVMGGQYTVREYQGRCISSGGIIKTGLSVPVNPILTEEMALEFALDTSGSVVYMWEDPANDSLLQEELGDPLATYYPEGELWIAAPRTAQYDTNDVYNPAEYRLTYRFRIHAESPLAYNEIYIDANNGELIQNFEMIRYDAEAGTAVTRYNGHQDIITNEYDGDYFLNDPVRSIHTRDMNQGTDYLDAVSFKNETNVWISTDYPDLDDAAWQAHWSVEKAYDYFKNVHHRDGFDGTGNTMAVGYVHMGNPTTGGSWWSNSWWDFPRLAFGDGDDANKDPYTSLDIVAHEYMHGVEFYMLNLRYGNESGALSEAISDMFGMAVEQWVEGDDPVDWRHGEDIYYKWSPGAGLCDRNLANPLSDLNPSFYLGQYWRPAVDNPELENDYGGVHHNCAVPCYWLYLVSDGGSGEMENGEAYSIEGIGLRKAINLVYKVLDEQRITDEAGFRSFCIETEDAAISTYGLCSPEQIAVTKAWHAVGLYDTWTIRDHVIAEDFYFSRNTAKLAFDNVTIKEGYAVSASSILEVRLTDGFHAEEGSHFHAWVGCQP